MTRNIQITENQLVRIIKKVLKEQQMSQEAFDRVSMDNANSIEILKNTRGFAYDKYQNKGRTECKPCSLTVSGSIIKDMENQLWCVNKSVLNFKKFDCPEGYNVYSVMGKEYGIYDLNDIPRIKNLIISKLTPFKRDNPVAKFVYDNRHEILLGITLAGAVMSFIPSLNVAGMAISFAADTLDASLYMAEGDFYNAGLGFLFATVGVVSLAKLGISGMNEAFIKKVGILGEKSKNGTLTTKWIKQTFTEAEQKILENMSKNSKELIKQFFSKTFRKLIPKVFQKATLVDLVSFYRILLIKYPKSIGFLGPGVTIGGLWYSWAKLSKIIGVDKKKTKELSSKFESEKGKEQVENATMSYILQHVENVDQNKVNLELTQDLDKAVKEHKAEKSNSDNWMYEPI